MKLLVLVKKINKYETLLFLLVFITFVPFREIISWGSDYAGYILQAKAMIKQETGNFINKQIFLSELSIKPKYPIYTPIGMPIIIGLTSFIHNYDIYLVRLIVPASVFFTALMIYRKTANYPLFLALMFLIHPSIVDQYKDAVLTESLGMLIFLGATFIKNFKLKTILYILAIFIRPTFFLLVVCDLFFTQKNRFVSKFLFLSLNLLIINFFTKSYFAMNFFGLYRSPKTEFESFTLVEIFYENIINLLTIERLLQFFQEIGHIIIGFSNPFNLFFGLVFISAALIRKNKYSIMIFIFCSIHVIWDTPSFIRYFIPVIPLTILWLDAEINQLKKFIPVLFFSSFVLSGLLFLNSVNNVQYQTGPHESESIEMINFVRDLEGQKIISFHSPRTLRLLSEKDSYWLDGNIFPGSLVACYSLKENCETIIGYKLIFQNDHYKIFSP